jgi:hypothetical protein
MWRELFGFTGAAFAVVNGLLAIAIALLPVRRSVLKLRLGVAAVVLGVAALGVTLAIRYNAHAQQEHSLADRRDTRERLEAIVTAGRAILAEVRDAQKPLPSREADEWAQQAEVFINERLGELYIARFRKDAGEMYGEANVPAPRLPYWRAVRNRLVNLESMLAELPQPLRSSPVATPKL